MLGYWGLDYSVNFLIGIVVKQERVFACVWDILRKDGYYICNLILKKNSDEYLYLGGGGINKILIIGDMRGFCIFFEIFLSLKIF